MRIIGALACWGCLMTCAATDSTAAELKVRISWGHRSPAATRFYVKPVTSGMRTVAVKAIRFENDDAARGGTFETLSGGGDVDGIELLLDVPAAPDRKPPNLSPMWRDLIAQSDEDTSRRLRADLAASLDSRRLIIQMNREGTLGFTLAAEQLEHNRAIRVPSLDMYVTAGDEPISFEQHQKELEAFKGRRILDQVHREGEATYEQYTARWEDMGSSAYKHPNQPAPGHIVCLTWDGAIHKFGIDRGAGVWSDYGNPDRFRLTYDFGEIGPELVKNWRGQKLADGLPIMTTTIERDSVRYEVEQFAYPLNGSPEDRRGEIPMVLLQKVKLTNFTAEQREISVRITHERQLPAGDMLEVAEVAPGQFLCSGSQSKAVFLSIEGRQLQISAAPGGRHVITVSTKLPPSASREFLIKLPSPIIPSTDRNHTLAIDYAAARAATVKFWSDCLARGAQFRVPEPAVNELFRANLWHALSLPRRHADGRIDLPYSNFAYGQNGIPWPINQAVYVNYMLYDLRGYHDLSAEELLAMYRANQEPSGHVHGYANWVVYTPGMVYATAQHYLLTGDRASFAELLPYTLKAADWCIAQITKAQTRGDFAAGLVYGPLNDGTGEGIWAFNQAYVYASLDNLAKALARFDSEQKLTAKTPSTPSAEKGLGDLGILAVQYKRAAEEFRKSIERGFGAATMRSPLVQLRDNTWSPNVPCEALSSGRRFDQWYPTDVDTGAVHLARLGAIAPDGDMANALLNDHEDNLFLKGWGMANEPVYNPQATAYLLRDDPKAAIRAFYSMMACAFSHSMLEPVEHRWTHGQYFGPPSTDGAWFELYRNMLIHERDDGVLALMSATPRKWLEEGKRIAVERAPTYFGPISVVVESHAATGTISADIQMPQRSRPKLFLMRLRHPLARQMRSVKVNGQDWKDFDAAKEWVRIPNADQKRYAIVSSYAE